MSMLTQQRHDRILKLLEEKGSVTVGELTELLDSSESTVRRDLLALDKLGKLNKVHGGATLTETQFIAKEEKLEEKLVMNVDSKRAIAKYAAAQVTGSDFVFLDAGSTTLLMISCLEPSSATFVTNGIQHAKELVKRGFKTYMLAGELKETTEAVAGLAAAQNILHYNFSKSFLGTNGVHLKRGFTTPDADEAFVKTAAIDRSFVSYVLADHSKFDRVSTMTFGQLGNSAIITDRQPDSKYGETTVVKVIPAETEEE